MHYLAFAVLLIIGPLVHSRPSSEIKVDDVIYTPEQLQFFEGNKTSRIVLSWSRYYWKMSTLVYSFGMGLSSSDQISVQNAMKEISSQTCVKFRRTFNRLEPQVIILRKNAGCWSYVGYLGISNQELNLGSGCMYSAAIQHELLHALGFYHTQSDPQRDQYVRILTENIKPGHEHNFNKLRADAVTNFGLGYDYDSIMHYGPFGFSRNGNPTIVPLQANVVIGQATRLSPRDVATLNRMYC
ncbi:hypothetical protein KR054_009133 [Drosophila jambulina]|nr:hypothetical protein KR054_009133 [Drosophila jambulina]